MPELPEVETIKRGLEKVLVGLEVTDFQGAKNKVLKNSPATFKRELVGKSFAGLERRGKMLIFNIKEKRGEKKKFLIVRLGMTGQLIFKSDVRAVRGGHSFDNDSDDSLKHCRARIGFKGGGELLFKDARMFGVLQVLDAVALEKKKAQFGVEPLSREFTSAKLTEILQGRKTSLKALLLDQGKVAGLGNIYVDEALFRAGILPTRRAESLTGEEIEKLREVIVEVLRLSIKHKGTTFSDYRNAEGRKGNFKKHLRVYHRQGEKCWRCGRETIQRTVVVGRGTHFCSRCQK